MVSYNSNQSNKTLSSYIQGLEVIIYLSKGCSIGNGRVRIDRKFIICLNSCWIYSLIFRRHQINS